MALDGRYGELFITATADHPSSGMIAGKRPLAACGKLTPMFRGAEDFNQMSAEFAKVGPNAASSGMGFTVIFHPAGGLDYTDATGTIRVDTELFVKPLRIAIYRESRSLKTLDASQIKEILANIVRAMDFLGHPTELM
jgi:hypothetical protein